MIKIMIICLLIAPFLYGQVVINEILANPTGGESSIPGGQSYERIDPSGASDPSNWALCDMGAVPFGSTPGTYNSQSPVPYDVALDSIYYHYEMITLLLSNQGYEISPVCTAYVYDDANLNGTGEISELIAQETVPSISVGVDNTIDIALSLADGYHLIIVRIAGDIRDANNKRELMLQVGEITQPVILTEIMNKPASGNPEWIELYNPADTAVSITGWTLGDGDDQNTIADTTIQIPANSFLVLAEDELAISDSCNGEVLVVPTWETLNNGDDRIVITDSLGLTRIDVSYYESWTSGCLDYDISMELISPDADPNIGSSWWCSRLGSTPGCENSLWGMSTSGTSVELASRSFAPSLGEKLAITYSAPLRATLRLRVYDITGRLRATLLEHSDPQYGSLDWNGGNLPIGFYILLADFWDENDAPLDTKKLTFAIATNFK